MTTLHTAACDLFGVRYPIVQTGMGFVSGPRLTAATCNAGGLGILAGATISYAELAAAIEETRKLTSAPFGVNLRADAPDAGRRAELLVSERVAVASFAMAPRQDLMAVLKEGGVVVVPSVGARRHAEKVAAWGADAVVVQGGEGGGHTGQVATTILLPQVLDAVDIPVIAAGGFFDGRGLVAALAYGAAGIAMGTRFLLTADSGVPGVIKQRYLKAGVADTVVTDALDGVPQRLLRTPFTDRLARDGQLARLLRSADLHRAHGVPLGQVLLAANTPALLRAAMVDGSPEFGVMATGQVAGLIQDVPTCAELITGIVRQAEGILARFASLDGAEGERQ
jgi:NAD(P)H-dependent flavin oxidoreductase YrpB (nitropropane dioxygenase family)